MTPRQLTLRVAALEVRYDGQPQATLRGVDVVARPGQVTAVVGPNGSGKSTIVRTLLRLVPVQHGAILLDEVAITTMTPRTFATQVAVVTQREEPAWPMTVEEFVAMGRHPHRSAFGALGATDRAHIRDAVVRAGVAEAVHRRTDQLSGGEWQRVRIARALAQDTPVLVLR